MNEATRKVDDLFAKIFKIIGKLLKYSFYAVIIAINGILFWRMFTSGDPQLMETLMVNDRTAAAYAEAGEALKVSYQKQYHLDEEGLFAQSNLHYIPSVSQLQVTTRYNNSTLKDAAETFELLEVPAREADVFDVTLVKVIASTQEEQEQADRDALTADVIGEDAAEPEDAPRKEVRYYPSAALPDQKTVYNYRRLIFDEVDLSDASLCYLEFYYNGAIDYDAEPYSELLVWVRGDDRAYELTKADRKALEDGAVVYD